MQKSDSNPSQATQAGNGRASRVVELGHLIATMPVDDGDLEPMHAELRGIVRECLDAGADDVLQLALKQASEANDRIASSCIEEIIEDECRSPLSCTGVSNEPATGSLFAIPVLVYSDRPFLDRVVPKNAHFDALVQSIASFDLVGQGASVHITNYLYTPDELWSLTWSQIRKLPSKIAEANEKGMTAPLNELGQTGEGGPPAYPGDNSALNLRYMLGVISNPAEEDASVQTNASEGLENPGDRKMEAWAQAAGDQLNRALQERGKDRLVDVMDLGSFYEAIRQGASGYNILSFMLQFDDLLQAHHAAPEEVAAIIALYEDGNQNLTARASIYTGTDEQVIGGCGYEIYPFEKADEAIQVMAEYLAEQGVADVSFVTEVQPDAICKECGEPRLIGPHPVNGKDPTLGFAHSHRPGSPGTSPGGQRPPI